MSEPGSSRPEPNPVALPGARLAAIVDSLDDAVLTISLDGIILTWNAAAEHIFGYSAAEVVGSSVDLLIPPGLRHEQQRILDRVRRGEQVIHHETCRVRRDGQAVPVELTVSPVRDSSGAVVGAAAIRARHHGAPAGGRGRQPARGHRGVVGRRDRQQDA